MVGLKQPLEVVVFELTDVLVLELFGDLYRFVPAMQLLIHGHCFLNLIMLNKDSLGFVELFVQDSELGLNSEVISSFLSDEFVKLAQVVSARHVSKSGIASLSNVEVLLLECQLGKSLPVGFCLRSQVKRFKDVNSGLETFVKESSSKFNKSFVEIV